MAAESYAYIVGQDVHDVIELPDGSPPISAMFHPNMVADMRALSAEDAARVKPGWRFENGGFVAPQPPPAVEAATRYVPASLARERLEQVGAWEAFAAVLAMHPAAMLKVLTLREGIDPNDTEARALITAAGADPSSILAPPPAVVPL